MHLKMNNDGGKEYSHLVACGNQIFWLATNFPLGIQELVCITASTALTST
jgi:hypothetical protein